MNLQVKSAVQYKSSAALLQRCDYSHSILSTGYWNVMCLVALSNVKVRFQWKIVKSAFGYNSFCSCLLENQTYQTVERPILWIYARILKNFKTNMTFGLFNFMRYIHIKHTPILRSLFSWKWCNVLMISLERYSRTKLLNRQQNSEYII